MKFIIVAAVLVTWAGLATSQYQPTTTILPFSVSYPEDENKPYVKSQAIVDYSRNITVYKFSEEYVCMIRKGVPMEKDEGVYQEYTVIEDYVGDYRDLGDEVLNSCKGFSFQVSKKGPTTTKREVEEDRHYNYYYGGYAPRRINRCSYYSRYPYQYGYPWFYPPPPPPPPPTT